MILSISSKASNASEMSYNPKSQAERAIPCKIKQKQSSPPRAPKQPATYLKFINYFKDMNELYLIGTVHIDIDGAERLKKLLEFLNPESIAVEMHEQGAGIIEEKDAKRNEIKSDSKKREQLLSMAQKEGYNIETAEAFLSQDIGMGYEYLVPKLYCKPKGIPLYLVDEPGRTTKTLMDDSTASLQSKEVYTGNEHIEAALRMSLQDLRLFINESYSHKSMDDFYHSILKDIEQEYAEKEKGDQTKEPLKLLDIMNIMKKDHTDHLVKSNEYVEKHLRELCKNHEKLVYIGGSQHLFWTYPFGEKNLYERMSDLQPVRLRLCDTDDIISHPPKYGIPLIST